MLLVIFCRCFSSLSVSKLRECSPAVHTHISPATISEVELVARALWLLVTMLVLMLVLVRIGWMPSLKSGPLRSLH